MNPNDEKFEAFKKLVIESSNNPEFIHHKWFVEYHLLLVEKIAEELLKQYPEADVYTVKVLVWLHDYGKTIDFSNQYEATLTEGRRRLEELGFESGFIDLVIKYMELIDKKLEVDISKCPIEVQIVSSADGSSHFIGPFMQLWWWENPSKDYKVLMEDTIKKAKKDWDYKIVLPEARQIIEPRYKFLLEQSGNLPDTFLA